MSNSPFEIVIEGGKPEKNYWADIWRYRELFYILTWRDIKVRYKQTAIGVLWSVIRPLLTMVVFTIIFNKVAQLPADGKAPYAIMVFVALLPWQFFSNALSESSASLVGNSNLISKVYFPRLIIPASSVMTSVVDFCTSFVLLLLLMVCYRYVPDWKIIFIPFFLMLAFLLSFGIGLLLTALNVQYRDFRYVIPFIIQFGLYISPVAFSSDLIIKKWRTLYSLNPMVGIIDGFKWCVLHEKKLNIESLISSVVITIIFLVIGIRYFRKMEKTFADHI